MPGSDSRDLQQGMWRCRAIRPEERLVQDQAVTGEAAGRSKAVGHLYSAWVLQGLGRGREGLDGWYRSSCRIRLRGWSAGGAVAW